MSEEKSPNREKESEINSDTAEFEEVDVSLDDDMNSNSQSLTEESGNEVDTSLNDSDISNSQETSETPELEDESLIPEEWKGKPESEIVLLREIQDLKAQLEEKETKWFDKYARLQAEFENFRRRSLKERDDNIKYANSQLISKLLPILDSADLMLKNLEQKLDPNEFQGIQMLINELKGVLAKEGLTPIKAEGEQFDPFIHEILAVEYTNDVPEDTIVEVFQKGYRFKDRVLRPSKVKISKMKQEEVKESESEGTEVSEETENEVSKIPKEDEPTDSEPEKEKKKANNNK
ncbi:MAG: nucleotide exchange factor GrpE [Candidatus Helarchaeota archaeon]